MGTYLETALLSFPSYLPLPDCTYCLLFVSVTGMKAPSEQGSILLSFFGEYSAP